MRSALWSRWHAETTAWAVRANEELLARLSPPVAGAVRARRETQVAIYGPTQSGKTTLVLRLLGVADDAFAGVEGLLRGGRPAGNSATAVPMRYSRSEDDQWRVGAGGGEPIAPDVLASRLRSLREKVEAGSHASTDPVELSIPRSCFADQAPAVRVSVLDLPGSHAAAPRERELVRRVAERHLPGAGLILLVSKADNLGVFDPARLGAELEQLRDWMSYPERYRLVTTHSFSAGSVRDLWVAGRRSGVDQMQEMLLEQFGRFERVRRSRGFGAIPFYPLEHGQTWAALRAGNPAYFAWADLVQDQLLRRLTNDVNGTADGARRLDIGRTMAREIHRRHERLEAEYRVARDASKDRVRRLEEEVERAQAAADRSGGRSEKLGAQLLELDGAADAEAAAAALLGAPEPPGEPPARSAEVYKWLEKAVDVVDKSLKEELPGCAPPDRRRFEELFERLEGYWIDYWPKLGGGFERDLELGKALLEEHRREVLTLAADHLRARASSELREVSILLRAARRQHALESQHLAERRALLGDERRAWTNTSRERLRSILVARRDRCRADEFDRQMRRHHLGEARRVATQARLHGRAGRPALLLARLCQLRLTSNVFRERCESAS